MCSTEIGIGSLEAFFSNSKYREGKEGWMVMKFASGKTPFSLNKICKIYKTKRLKPKKIFFDFSNLRKMRCILYWVEFIILPKQNRMNFFCILVKFINFAGIAGIGKLMLDHRNPPSLVFNFWRNISSSSGKIWRV